MIYVTIQTLDLLIIIYVKTIQKQRSFWGVTDDNDWITNFAYNKNGFGNTMSIDGWSQIIGPWSMSTGGQRWCHTKYNHCMLYSSKVTGKVNFADWKSKRTNRQTQNSLLLIIWSRCMNMSMTTDFFSPFHCTTWPFSVTLS